MFQLTLAKLSHLPCVSRAVDPVSACPSGMYRHNWTPVVYTVCIPTGRHCIYWKNIRGHLARNVHFFFYDRNNWKKNLQNLKIYTVYRISEYRDGQRRPPRQL